MLTNVSCNMLTMFESWERSFLLPTLTCTKLAYLVYMSGFFAILCALHIYRSFSYWIHLYLLTNNYSPNEPLIHTKIIPTFSIYCVYGIETSQLNSMKPILLLLHYNSFRHLCVQNRFNLFPLRCIFTAPLWEGYFGRRNEITPPSGVQIICYPEWREENMVRELNSAGD